MHALIKKNTVTDSEYLLYFFPAVYEIDWDIIAL